MSWQSTAAEYPGVEVMALTRPAGTCARVVCLTASPCTLPMTGEAITGGHAAMQAASSSQSAPLFAVR
jgi:hypothetical protein